MSAAEATPETQPAAANIAQEKTLLPSPAAFLFATVAFAIVTVRAHTLLNTDGDLARHIRVGSHILESRSIPRADVFSHTMYGEAFMPYEWLSEILFAAAHAWRGLPGVAVLSALVIASACTLVYLFCVHRGVDALLSFVTASAVAVVSAVHWLARPHLFTILAVILLLFLLHRSDKRAFAWTVVLFAFWTNLHGGFVYGLVLISVFLIGELIEMRLAADSAGWRERARHHARMLACAAIGTLLNPAGIELHAHVFGYLGNSYLVDHTMEYLSPNFHVPALQLFLATLLLLLGLLGLNRRRMALPSLLVIVANTGFALYSARNIPLFAVTALPLAAVHFDADWRALSSRIVQRLRAAFEMGATRSTMLPWILVAAGVLIAIAFNGGKVSGVQVTPVQFDAHRFPVTAVQRARAAKLEGRIFNEFGWGGYLLYAWPEQRVFIDGQTDFYGADLTRTYAKISQLEPGWRPELAARDIRIVVVPAQSRLAVALALDAQWHVWYRDSVAAVIVRATL